ncbi:uncharacterized protein LOC113290655 [Papaver somniferum]|uniref:uncharacterized protein LOC113290655 n=1 Tax=Papaver somniferum TaxID=3469 RepID=UPI000E6F61EF|nr:uncharacterized protein LOC113290655 [Papaver somniferum]
MEEQKCHSAAAKNVRPNSSSFTNTGDFSNTAFPPKPISTSYTTSREKGLCYNCDEVYSLGHKCKGRQQLFMLQTESSDTQDTKVEDEVFEEAVESPVDSDMEIYLHALTGTTTVEHTSHMLVTVANGEKTVSTGICYKLPWSMQGYKFSKDFRLLPLGGCDMVLGADWLRKLGDVMFNFSKLSVSFVHHGQYITLQGITNSPSLLMMNGSAVKRFIEKTTHGLIGHLLSVTTNPIPPPTPAPLLPLLSEYKDIFDEPTSLPPHRTLDHSITLKPNSQPPNQRPYRCPYIQKGVLGQLVKEMLSSGIIQHSHNPFASPILLVKKKDNTWRFCVDYRRLNNITIKEKFPIPVVDELLDELKGFLFLSKLDLRAGYHQILLNPMDIYKTAFRTYHGHYQFKVMPFGLANAPATFQALMNEVFASYLRKFVLLEYLGHIITPAWVCADPNKIAAMQNWPIPTSIKELRGFLGLTGYYRKFVKNYGAICKPLTDFLRKNSFNWNAVATSAFEQLKLAMSSTPVLALPDFSKPFTVESDASEHCLGVVLTQDGKPISFFSSPLGSRARALSTYKKEFLTIVKAVQKWRHYLMAKLGSKLTSQLVGDDKVQQLIAQLLISADSVPHYTYKSEIMRYKNRIYVGASNGVRTAILNTLHTSDACGHSGIQATYIRAKSHFFWPKMKKEIILFVTECDIFHRNKGDCSFPVGLLQPLPIPEHAWQHITMDFIEGLPMSDMKSVILVVVERLTKYSDFMALQHPYTAASVAKVFLDQALYGYLPPHMAFPSSTTTSVAAVESYLKDREAMIDILKESLHTAQARMKFFADKSRQDRTFVVGDLVYMKLQPYRKASV